MKKLLLSALCAFGALTLPLAASAETATFPATGSTWATSTWTQSGDNFTATIGGFGFTLAKGTSTNDLVAPDEYSIRVYAGAKLTIKAPSGYVMTAVEGTTASNNKALGTTVSTGWKNETGTIEDKANQPFKFTSSTGLDAITFDGNGKQLRVKNVTITYHIVGSADKASAGLSFPQASYTVNLGEDFTAPELTKAEGTPAAAYTSSDAAVATVDAATGAVTIVAAGTTTITATTAENDKFNAGSASYTLEVIDPNKPGVSIDNPMTVAQALAACADKPNGVYVKGIVKEVTTEYSTQYKNVSFTIVDAETDTEALECFRAKWGSDVTPTADNNPVVGATVVMYGNLTIYNGKKEINSGGQIVSYIDTPTSISEIVTEGAAAKAVYDLQGRRVANATKGIFIIGGKKVRI